MQSKINMDQIENRKALSSELAEYRKKKGVTAYQIEKQGCRMNTTRRIEAGENVYFSMMQIYLKELGIDLEELIRKELLK